MKDIDVHQVQSAFGNVTFNRGMGYYENKYVLMRVKKGNKLIGTVIGAMPEPYRVWVEITDTINSRCSCPVGVMCKHGVALILEWINHKDSFLDADDLMVSLEAKDKNELLDIINLILEEDPFLASKLGFSKEIDEVKVNMESISTRIDYSMEGFIDYYAVSGVVHELEEVKKIADNQGKEGNLRDAIEIYLLIIEKGAKNYGNVDDSSGELGDLVAECVEDASNSLIALDEEDKQALVHRIIRIVEKEDYGLETEQMLFAVATPHNMHIIEEELLRRVPEAGVDNHSRYQRRKIIELVSSLYMNLNLPENSLKTVLKAGLENKDDYLRIASFLVGEGRSQEAFVYVTEGLQLKEERNYSLDKLYFDLMNRFSDEKWLQVNERDALEVAVNLLSYHRDIKKYSMIKRLFIKIEKYDELLQAIITKCDDSVVIPILLKEDRLDEAVKRAFSSRYLYSDLIVKVAEAAKDKGQNTDAVNLTLKALEKGQFKINATFVELVDFLVEELEDEKIEEAINLTMNVPAAKIFATALLKRSQESALRLLERLLPYLEKAEIKFYMERLNAEYVVKLSKPWISQTVNISHIHYNDALDILMLLKEMISKAEFEKYVHWLAKSNKGKKKLLKMMEERGLI
jgi:uncharacterized Zn finger protein